MGTLKVKFDDHIGYEKNQHSKSENFRNISTNKIKSSFGMFDIQTPRNRQTTFKPKIDPKKT